MSPRVVQADARADRMLKILKKQPPGMSRDSWQEARRESARELGRLKDRRAVPTLLRIIAKERFDVILELAIDALGEIGDKQAVDPLNRLLRDPSLDAYVRDAVASALRKLGSGEAPSPVEPTAPEPRPRTTPSRRTSEPSETSDRERRTSASTEKTPPNTDIAPSQGFRAHTWTGLPALNQDLATDAIAFSDQWEIVAGAADFQWDKATGELGSAFALGSHFRRQMEKKSMGYTLDGALDIGFRFFDPPSTDPSWNLTHGIQLNPEIRLYPFQRDIPQLFGQISGGVGYALDYAGHPLYFNRRFSFAGNLAVGGGPGYGRIYDIGARLRLKRLAYALKKAGVLSGTIDSAVGNQIIYAWYQLRNNIGTYHHLGAVVDILSKANLLHENLDPATTYRLIRILDDPQLDQRLEGIMLRLGYGYARSLIREVDDMSMGFVYATAEWQHQLTVSRGIEAQLRFYYEMLGDPDTYGFTAQAAYHHYFYNQQYDPLGSLAALLSGGMNNQPGSSLANGGVGYQILIGAAYTRYLNRGSKLVASLRGGMDTGSPLIMFSLEAQYGVAYGSFAPAD